MKYLATILLLLIIVFINFNIDNSFWDFIYYCQNYILVSFFIYIGFLVSKSVIARSILVTLGFYYLFEFSMDIIKIIDLELFNKIYTTKIINFVLSGSLALSLLILPIFKKWK